MKTEIETKERISKQTGRTMIFIAVLFDLIPALVVVAILGFGVFFIAGSDIGQLAKDVNTMYKGDEIRNRTDISFWQKLKIQITAASRSAKTVVTKGTELVAGVALAFVFIPLFYTIASFLSTFSAYLLFTVWFLYKGVNIWSFTKFQKIATTAATLLIENLPLVDLLPGTTIMVWRHVKTAQIEDQIKNNEKIAGMQKALSSRRTRRRQPAYA